MKPFRTTVILLALLVLPLFATQGLAADFFVPLYDVPDGLVGKNTDNRAVIGFELEDLEGETLDKITVRSYIQHFYATEYLKLWIEDGTTPGFQPGEDDHRKTINTSAIEFDINDEVTFLNINYLLPTNSEFFYITLDVNTAMVTASPEEFHGTGLDVTMEPGYIVLENGDANSNPVRNPGWIGPPEPSYDPYTLYFDVFGPYFDLHFCIEGNSCSTYAYYDIEPYIRPEMVDQEDTIRVCATNVEGDIDDNVGIHVIGRVRLLGYVSSMHMFGVSPIVLTDGDSEEDGCDDECGFNYNTTFVIPDRRNAGQPGGLAGFWGVDADTGHWYVCAWAQDTVGNRDTICIGHEDLVYRIDTQKPIIDSVSWEFVTDLDPVGKINLGDCIMIIGWGRSNPIEPLKECDKMEVDWVWYTDNPDADGHDWIELDDVLENNRIFRKVFCLTDPVLIDSTDCAVNFLVRAWDNACNYDTLRDSLCGTIDLWPPDLEVEYLWETDYDTTWACMGIGDQVLIRAHVGGADIASVTAMMDSAGIDSLMQHAMPLFEGPAGIYDTIWTITKPPIKYGKDRDNTEPPDRDADYRVWVTACDDVNNCVTVASNVLNKTLDTRRPRPIGYPQFCPDSVPCALVATSQAGGIIELAWDTLCQEYDAFAYYVWASYEGAPFDSIGMTDKTEQPPATNIYTWHSEPLEAGYWEFMIQTEDNCSNVGPFSCVVGALADSTPPNACIVYPDSGRTFGSPFTVKALTEDADIDSVCLWYRLRHDLNDPPGDPGPWERCLSDPCMYRPDDGFVFFDTIACLLGLDYVGWVELLPTACDVIGNCQDTIRAYEEACIDDDDQNLVPGHFLFLWDPTRCQAQVVNVNGAASPQSMCGFDVRADTVNWVEINVLGATAADSFTIDVRALVDDEGHRILYRNDVTMPFIIDSISVENWPAGTQQLFVYVTSQANDSACVPSPMEIDLCVPPQIGPCMRIELPREWTRIPCSETESTCVQIWAELEENCPEEMVTQVKFKYSVNAPGPPWYFIDEVFYKDGDYWKTCWNNKGLVNHGDTVYLIAIGYNQFHMPDTSEMVKVFVDCEAPNVALIVEDVISTCHGIDKVSGWIILKAEILDTLVDIYELSFWYKLHSSPDLPANWTWMCDGEPAWYNNIYTCVFNTDALNNNTWYDIRIKVVDQARNMWQDEDEDGMFDDSTFWEAVAVNAGITVFVDNEAPKPAISMVADPEASIYNVNPSPWLGGNGKAYVKAGDDITAEISVLPSEDTCEVMKVEWFLCPEADLQYSPPSRSSSSGSGFGVNGSGVDCSDPIVLEIPAHLPVSTLDSTCGRSDDYDKTCLLAMDGGEDIIYQLNVSLPVDLDFLMIPLDMREGTGMVLGEGCPPCSSSTWPYIRKSAIGGWGIHEWYNVHLEPGTYHLMIDSRQQGSPWNCISAFQLIIEGGPTNCMHVGTSTDPYHYPITFNPLTDGLIPDYELEDGWWKGYLKAKLYDSLGNFTEDTVALYILDVTPTQAVIVEPINDDYVWGDVTLKSLALDAYEICELCYQYKHEDSLDWKWVNEGHHNACTSVPEYFTVVWHTLNTVEDGKYYLRAVVTDCSNNVDTSATIRVTVANGMPAATVYLDSTQMCFRECPDDTVDTLGYVGGMVTLYAMVDADGVPVDSVVFWYKNIFTYPSSWGRIGMDEFPDNYPTGDLYSKEWNTLSSVSDGRYHVKATVYNRAGRYSDSDPIVVTVDNTAPFSEIISIMGDHSPDGMDISKGDVIPIELVAMDNTSPEGWTRCYNSGMTKFSVCIERCGEDEFTKCFEVDPFYGGDTTIMWNTSGLEFEGCEGCYYFYVKAWDCLGNMGVSDSVKVYVSDITAPVTTIGGFDGNYIYGYSSERVSSLAFQYADSGGTNWMHIGWSDTLHIESYNDGPSGSSCGYYLYKTSWNPDSLANGVYQVRVISHDTCSNQDDDMAPVGYFTMSGGVLTPYSGGVLHAMSFEKNWCVGGMHGIVRQTSDRGTPVVIGIYGSVYECVDMQSHLQNTTEYAGSFFASEIDGGGTAKFLSSVTVTPLDEPQTGEPAWVTYFWHNHFDVVQVKRDLGTHGIYQNGCVEVTIPGGAVGGTFEYDRYIWVAPTMMPWAPITQPDIKPIGDNNGYATYVSFTDCYYCCGWWRSHFGDDQGTNSGAGGESSDDCCFNPNRWAKIKMCYDTLVTTSKEHLAVMWWDCQTGQFKYDPIALDILGVEGFNTEQHYVEFATTCLKGPFAVVEILERPCEGTIVVSVKQQDIYPYFNGYTNTKPRLSGYIDDNHPEGTSWIDRSSIKFKLDLREPGDLITIYDGGQWADGFGSFAYSGYDTTSGIFRAGWSAGVYPYDNPAKPLAGGDHIATLTAQNRNLQTCTDTVHFMVDATPPVVIFEQKCLGIPPEFDIIIIDRESGVNRDSVYVRFAGNDLNPSQLASMWDNDTLLHVKWPYSVSGGIREARVWNGNNTGHGPVDMVGNWSTALKHDYQVDATAPHISLVKNSYRFRRPVLFNVYDDGGCGLYKIMFDECTGPTGGCTAAPEESLVYDPQTEILRYYPPTSGAWIQATVKDSAHNTTWLDSIYCVEDYDPPMVSFVPGYNGKYVGTDPTIKFVVTDGVAGVDWESVNAEIDGCNNKCTFPWTEVLNHMENDTVTLSCPLSCNDSSGFWVYVYSDYRGGKGPADKADNHIRYTQQWQYWVDKAGPSITLKTPSDSLCNRPLLFEIKDSKSGLYVIEVYEDSSLVTEDTTLTPYPHIPDWWKYYPSVGAKRLDLVAIDSLGNETHYGMDIKTDCMKPVVWFEPGLVGCINPTFTFAITDDDGVDWSTVCVDLYLYADRIQTFCADTLDVLRAGGDTVTLVGDGEWLGLSDGQTMNVYVYSEKNYGTSYQKGPKDLSGNYHTSTNYYYRSYTVDCAGPTITWKSGADSCARPLLFLVSESSNRSGVESISITEDDTLMVPDSRFSYDYATDTLKYYPDVDRHKVDIVATDKVGNANTFEFWSKDDCEPPTVAFGGGFVSCESPTVTIEVTDDASGVDWSSVYVDFYTSTYRLQTFYPESLANLRDGNVITVTGDGDQFSLYDGNLLDVVIYSYKSSGTGYSKGPVDSSGNWTETMWIHKQYYVDCYGPTMSLLTKSYDSPVKVEVEDKRSGVDANSFVITENGVEVTSYSYDASTGVLSFTPTLGVKTQVHISVSDNVGNIGFLSYHNYDNDSKGPTFSFASKYKTDGNIMYTTEVPVKVKVADANSGIDWNSLVLKVDGEEMFYYESESLIIEQDQGLVEYFPGAGRKQIVITITDNAGNISDPFIFWTEAGELFLTDTEHGPHNFPNPFDPREGYTTIILGLSKSAEVTAKIYDFAGEFVRTLVRSEWISPSRMLYWDGKTEDGETEVGNGTYLCHIKARDPETSKTVTAVIKITVLKEDK